MNGKTLCEIFMAESNIPFHSPFLMRDLKAANAIMPPIGAICIYCGEPMAPATERPPSGGNPNQCVPCVCGIDFPADGSAAYRPKDGPTNLPPATAPEPVPDSGSKCIARDGGTATTPAGGNPIPRGRWT